MSTYREIVGKKIKEVSSDPSSGTAGEMWWNSTTGTFRGPAILKGFTAGSNKINATQGDGFGITQNAMGSVQQLNPSSPTPAKITTELYNGSGWSSGPNRSDGLLTRGGGGPQTAAIAVGGYTNSPFTTYNTTEEYNGTSWTAGGNLGTASYTFGGVFGISGSAMGFTARNPGPSLSGATEEYNGTAWTGGGAIGTTVTSTNASGAQDSAVIAGGIVSSADSKTAWTYNGSSWTSISNMANDKFSGASSGQTDSDYIIFGGSTEPPSGDINKCESWNGTSWTEETNTPYSFNSGGSGSAASTATVFFGGSPEPSNGLNTVEWNVSTDAVTAAAWASGGTVPYTSRQNMSFGTQTAALNCGGYTTTTLNTAAEYDGASWTASPALNVAARMGGVAGTTGAGLQFGGIQPPGTYNTNVQTWNGSAWANNPLNLSVGTYGLMGCGTQTAALKVGGENPGGGNYTSSEEYDGEGWTAGGALPEAKYVGAGNGIQTSAIITGGSPSGTNTFEYNGSSWTAGGSLMTSRPGTQAGSAGADSDSNIVFGGGPALTTTEGYDGTAWSTRPSLGTGRGSTNGNGIATAGLMVSGGPPSGTTTATEEFTGQTTSVNIKDFATS